MRATLRLLASILVSPLVAVCWAESRGDKVELVHSARHWGGQRIVDASAAYDVEPRLAVNTRGQAAIAWRSDDATGKSRVWITVRSAGGGAALAPQALSAADDDAVEVELAVSESGHLFVAWYVESGPASLVCMSRLVVKPGRWDRQRCLPAARAAGKVGLRVAANANGDAVVVWSAADGLMSSRFDSSQQRWSDKETVFEARRRIASLQLRLDWRSNALLVWQQNTSDHSTQVRSSRFDMALGRWTIPVPLDPDGVGDQSEPRLAIDATGSATVVWLRRFEGRADLWAAKHDATTNQFGPSAEIAVDVGPPDLAVDKDGDAIVVWTQMAPNAQLVRARRFRVAAQGWGQTVTIATAPSFSLRDPSVAIDAKDGAMAVWNEVHGVVLERVFAARFDALRDRWQVPVQIGEHARGFGSGAKVALDPSGAGVAVWSGFRAVRANTFR